jgi:A/G-specific adenine glycosylase
MVSSAYLPRVLITLSGKVSTDNSAPTIVCQSAASLFSTKPFSFLIGFKILSVSEAIFRRPQVGLLCWCFLADIVFVNIVFMLVLLLLPSTIECNELIVVSMKMRVNPDPEILLEWYDRHRRTLEWRALPGELVDPYAVWLSEIMLQQTTVAAVTPYYRKFLLKWPAVADLASADLDEVLSYWAGLGYYARARNLHACAKTVHQKYGGRFPDTQKELMALPGIGDYTSAAITSIAFDKRAVVVDGNVERVIARVYGLDSPLPKIRNTIKKIASEIMPLRRFGDYAQGLMDLGSLVCRPRNPNCDVCPWKTNCLANSMKTADDLPRRSTRKLKPTRYGICFWVESSDGTVLVRRRPEKGLLGGMLEVPSTSWKDSEWSLSSAQEACPIDLEGHVGLFLPSVVKHSFSHFNLRLKIQKFHVLGGLSKSFLGRDTLIWLELNNLEDHAFPSVMRKVISYSLMVN